jgi:hypothetical protein
MGVTARKGDPRTIKLRSVLNTVALPPLPTKFLLYDALPVPLTDKNMYSNDVYGCCVISERGHHTLVFEDIEQGIVINIPDQDIITEYFKETGGWDNGLYILDSLNAWRKGWTAAGKTYNIFAFAEVNPKDHVEVCAAIYLLKGLNVAVNLSLWCTAQFNYGNPWTYSPGDSIVGGHCVYIVGFDTVKGLLCVTWGGLQWMTWEFWDNMCTEAYVIIDDKDSWVDPATNPLNIEEMQRLLNMIQNIPPESITGVSVHVVDKNNVPVEHCQVNVFKPPIISQTYATTSKNGIALFQGLSVGTQYIFGIEYQAPDYKVTMPIEVTKTLNPTDASTIDFTVMIPFDYIASVNAHTVIT